MFHPVIRFAIFALTINMVFGQKTLLKDVETITLHRGQKTTGGRTSPVPQMACVGAGCHIRQPSTAQCHNKGSDGNDAQWECVAKFDYKYKFGKIEVLCEGYEYPNDPYILTGSCGLEYTIEYTTEYTEKGRNKNSDSISGVFILIITLVIIVSLCDGSYRKPSNTSSFMGGVATGMAVNSYYRRSGYGGGYGSGYRGSSRSSSGFGGTRRR